MTEEQMDKDKLWKATLAQLQLTLTRPTFSLWFGKTFIKSAKGVGKRQIVEIACQNTFAKEKLETNYLAQVGQILDSLTGCKNEIKFVVASKEVVKTFESSGPLFTQDYEKEAKELLARAQAKAGLSQNFTFQNFAVASTNEMAYAATTRVVKNPGKAYNPLFLYGGVGVGKTHLMQAIGIAVLQRQPQTSILYRTGEEFTNEIIEAIRGKNTGFFKKKYRYVQLLLVDDIQFIAGHDFVQEEFFHTFNAIKQAGGQIVLTSDRLPEQTEGLEDRLRSRFEGGLMIDIQEPNFELRTAILLIKAKQAGEDLPIEVAKLIAQQIKSTRKLEGALARILSEKSLGRKRLDLEFVKEILAKINGVPADIKSKTTPAKIIKVVAQFYQISLSQIKGKRRLKNIVFPRQMAIYVLRTELGLAYQEIGHLFGGKDHTTIMHSEAKIKKLLASSAQIKEEMSQIRKRLI